MSPNSINTSCMRKIRIFDDWDFVCDYMYIKHYHDTCMHVTCNIQCNICMHIIYSYMHKYVLIFTIVFCVAAYIAYEFFALI